MALRFTEQHALSLVTPHLFPGEQILHRARGIEKPWYSWLFFRMGALFWKYFLVVATNQRILFIQHKGLLGGYGVKAVESYSWAQIGELRLGWGIFNKTLKVRAPAIGFSRNVELNRFQLPNNFGSAEGIVATFDAASRSLAGAGAAPQLGAPQYAA